MNGRVPRTVLVTGAMGQVGKRVVEILLRRGRTVVALDLRTRATEATAAALVRSTSASGRLIPAYVDLLDFDAVHAVVRDAEPAAIVHLAAVVSPPCYRNPRAARAVNVTGTQNVVVAAQQLPSQPSFIEASSSAVYGSRNPYRNLGRITSSTPVAPVDCYGEDKIAAEEAVAASGLRHAILRIGGVISPDGLTLAGPDYLVLMRATPRDNRVHVVDARDVALAFANAVDRIDRIDGRVLLIGGDESCVLTHANVQDDVFAAIGIGRIGPRINLPGDPSDDLGWGLTDWFDTTESESLLDFQQYHWNDSLAWLAGSLGWRRALLRMAGPLIRPAMRLHLARLRWQERRGPYADPWALISRTYGPGALAGGNARSTTR